MPSLEIPLVGGLDESVNRKLVSPPGLVVAENHRIDERGITRKRRGTAALAAGTPDSGTPIGPVRLANHNGQILVCSEEGLWTVAADGARLEELDALPSTTLERVVSLGHYGERDVVSCSCAETTDFRVWAWGSYTGSNYNLHVMVLDTARGAGSAVTYVPIGSLTAAVKCLKAITIGTKVSVFIGYSTNAVLVVDVTSPTAIPATGTVLYTDVVQTDPQFFDVSPHETGYALVYRSTSTAYKVKRMSSAHAELATGTFTPGTFGTSPRFGVAGDTNGIAVAVGGTGTTCLSLFWYNNSITQTATAALSETSVFGGGTVDLNGLAIAKYNSSGTVAFGAQALASTNIPTVGSTVTITRMGTVTTGGTLAVSNTLTSTTIASKPWVYAGDVYMLTRFRQGTDANSYYAVTRFTGGASARLVTQYPVLESAFLNGRASSATLLDDGAASVAQTGSATSVMPVFVDRYSSPGVAVDPTGQSVLGQTVRDATAATGTMTVVRTGVDGYTFDHASRSRWQAVHVGQYTCFGGGLVSKFDGRRATEIGFASFPYPYLTTVTGGGSIENGTYAIGCHWEWQDYLGNVEQSAAWTQSNVDMTTGSNNHQLLFDVFSLAHSAKEWRLSGADLRYVTLVCYRTATVGSVDGTLLFRVEGPSAPRFPSLSLASSATLTSVNFTDTSSQSSIGLTGRPTLYTSSSGVTNELQHMMPPPSNILCSHESRLFGVRADKPSVVWYTLQQFVGYSLAWNESLVIDFGEDITALASQDGNFIAFSENKVFTVVGRPPDNTGASTGYDPPQLLSGHIGCESTARRSVVSTPLGVFFKSARGIHVLPRGGNTPQYIGEPVRETLMSYPVVTAALHVPDRSEVWFSLVDVETTSGVGRVVVYDYNNKAWFVRSYNNKPIADMCLDGNDVVLGIYDSAAGLTLWKEDGGFDDANGAFITRRWRTGDIRMARTSGGQSVSHITLMGEVSSNCMLTIGESTDSGVTWRYQGPRRIAATERLLYEYQVFDRKANAHAFEVIETQIPSGSADQEGLALAALRINGAPFRQSARLPDFKRT